MICMRIFNKKNKLCYFLVSQRFLIYQVLLTFVVTKKLVVLLVNNLLKLTTQLC